MEEICCITNEGKPARNEWENDDSELYTVYLRKLGQIFSIFYLLYIILLQVINTLKN